MDIDQTPETKNISRVARILIPLLYLGLIFSCLVGFVFLALLVFSDTAPSGDDLYPHIFNMGKLTVTLGMISNGVLTLAEKLLIGLMLNTWTVLAMWGFFYCIQLTECFARFDVFSNQSVNYTSKIAQIYSGYFTLFIALPAIITVLLGHWRAITPIDIFTSLIILGSIWLFVWILRVGRDLLTDNQMTI